MSIVLDASTALSFLLEDEFDATAQSVLDEVRHSGAVVPSLWHFELFNALSAAERRGRITQAGIAHALHGLGRLRIETDSRPEDGVQIIDLARRFILSAYDAAYLWLAIESNLRLATRDERLAQAARDAGVVLC